MHRVDLQDGPRNFRAVAWDLWRLVEARRDHHVLRHVVPFACAYEIAGAHLLYAEHLDSAMDRQAKALQDRKSTRLNSSHMSNSYAVFCLEKKKCSHDPYLGHEATGEKNVEVVYKASG